MQALRQLTFIKTTKRRQNSQSKS